MKVDFMIIGAMKCATSSLSSILAEHPDISFSRPKEPQFFSDVTNWRDKLDDYHDLFRHKKARLYGEGSTNYTKAISSKSKVWEELYSYNKDLKLIYLIRHPVERAVSHYLHGFQRGFIRQSFHSALCKSELLFVGRYHFQILPYIEQFGREKVLILKFEDFIRDHRSTLERVSGFLDIDNSPFEEIDKRAKNVVSGRRVLTIQQERKVERYQRVFKLFYHDLMTRGMREWMLRKNENRLKDFKFFLTKEEEEKILAFYRLDIVNLQPLVPFDITDYLVPSDNGRYRPGVPIYPFRRPAEK